MNVLCFEDYSKEELLEILRRDLTKEGYRLTRTARQYVAEMVGHLVENQKQCRMSARLIKLMAEMMIRNRMQRLTKQDASEEMGVCSITMKEVKPFTTEWLESLTIERNTIGFKM